MVNIQKTIIKLLREQGMHIKVLDNLEAKPPKYISENEFIS